MAGDVYSFVDGAYLGLCFEERFRANFGDYHGIRFDLLPYRGSKTFYYDCLDDIKKDDESQEQYESRVKAQELEFERIASLSDWHVRQGTLSGNSRPGGRRARRQQKEVDVLLAVDMMNHAFRQNMSRAILVTGDLDFKPVVESLIQLGCHVTVAACEQSCHRELRLAADTFIPITILDLFRCSKLGYTSDWDRFFPTVNIGNVPNPADNTSYGNRASLLDQGLAGERFIYMYQVDRSQYIAFLPQHINKNFQQCNAVQCLSRDRALIEKYVAVEFGSLKWK